MHGFVMVKLTLIWPYSGTGLTRRPFKPKIRGSSPRRVTSANSAKKHRYISSGKSVRVGLIRQTTAWGRVAHESLARVLSQ